MDSQDQIADIFPVARKAVGIGNRLHNLPSELRIKIFALLCVNWEGRVPNVIKALRGDLVLYHEALEELYRSNVYVFSKKNGWSSGDMTKEAVKSITRARIVIE